jgi:formylglycine-generating enzyme required for sulfatase activity
MAGNVWEWVADEAVDENGSPLMKDGVPVRIAKGGAANEPSSFIGVQARATLLSDKPRQHLGFRYVVIRKAVVQEPAKNEQQ